MDEFHSSKMVERCVDSLLAYDSDNRQLATELLVSSVNHDLLYLNQIIIYYRDASSFPRYRLQNNEQYLKGSFADKGHIRAAVRSRNKREVYASHAALVTGEALQRRLHAGR
ncbi:hypothetical protein EVAR_57997_1 [Eumeta japonica]|uniref:Uncharacterized protein n=1 Tax=Eumeta variegata TaxID=151549 RepID=A0A4C1Y7K2_EUMVA|nr:hypothetical protein EVAR_57997_1 [Eumeta japonica]